MLTAAGLRTHIWNNNLKSVVLLAGFPVLLILLSYAGLLLYGAFGSGSPPDVAFIEAGRTLPSILPWVLIGAGVWFTIAWFFHQKIIDASVGARSVSRTEEPELYNLLENLCISRGMAMPRLKIIETDARNAFASGLTERQYTVTVTRGLMSTLETDELEAVLAHELSHIRHKDVRLLVISVIFVGIISFAGEMLARGMFYGGLRRTGGSRRGSGGNAAIIVLVAVVIIAIAYALAMGIRFALSRRREYMADAGAVEMTKNPDAMIRALEKISGAYEVEKAPGEVREMFIFDKASGFANLFSTHPSLEQRVEALRAYAS